MEFSIFPQRLNLMQCKLVLVMEDTWLAWIYDGVAADEGTNWIKVARAEGTTILEHFIEALLDSLQLIGLLNDYQFAHPV